MSHVHFGGLEAHAVKLAEARKDAAPPVDAPREELSYEARRQVERHRSEQRALRERHIAESLGMNAPALDKNVRSSLRSIGEPQTFFGEDAYSRRMRLRNVIAQRKLAGESLELSADMRLGDEEEDEQKEAFFTEGSVELRDARVCIARHSVPLALQRNHWLRERKFNHSWQVLEAEHSAHVTSLVGSFSPEGSQQLDLRPLSCARFSCDGRWLATTNWGGEMRIWDAEKFEPAACFSVSTHRLSGIAWHQSKPGVLAAAGGDGACHLVRFAPDSATLQPITKLTGHEDRVNQVEFHPLSSYLFSASHDGTWRMWDIETEVELLLQEGHAMPVQAIALHKDGSLLVSADTGSVIRVWDLRTGRAVLVLEGHAKAVVAVDTHPANGYSVASGSDDHTVKIWDLRRRTCTETLLGHSKLVSGVRFEPGTGRTLFSASFDESVKVWATNDWSCHRNLLGATSPVHGLDVQIASGGRMRVATASKNRMVSLWSATVP